MALTPLGHGPHRSIWISPNRPPSLDVPASPSMLSLCFRRWNSSRDALFHHYCFITRPANRRAVVLLGAGVWSEPEDARQRRVDSEHASLGRGPDDDFVDVADGTAMPSLHLLLGRVRAVVCCRLRGDAACTITVPVLVVGLSRVLFMRWSEPCPGRQARDGHPFGAGRVSLQNPAWIVQSSSRPKPSICIP